MKVELRNDHHKTRASVEVLSGYISPLEAKLARRKLCPFDDCLCSCNPLGVRGEQVQPFDNYELVISRLRNGGYMIYYQAVPGQFARGY